MAIPPTALFGSFFAVKNWLANSLASDRENRDFSAESELLDGLRHANVNSHKYIITLYMKSGRTIIGRVGIPGEDYKHESYDKHRGTLTVMPERDYPDGVSYEQLLVKLSEIEGFLLQDVNFASPEQTKALQAERDNSVIGNPTA